MLNRNSVILEVYKENIFDKAAMSHYLEHTSIYICVEM